MLCVNWTSNYKIQQYVIILVFIHIFTDESYRLSSISWVRPGKESIVKYQEEIYAFEEKPKENDNHDEDPVSAEKGKEKDEKDEDLPIKEGEEKLVPIDELMSPSKDAEDNNRSTLHSQTNHSSLLDMVENAAKYYKSAISSDETREASEDKKHDSLELEEMVYSF